MTLRKRSDRSTYAAWRMAQGADLGEASKAEVEADRRHEAEQLERGERAFWAAQPWALALGGAASNLRLALDGGHEATVSKYVDLIVSVARRSPEAERVRLLALVPGDPAALACAAERLASQALEDALREQVPAPAQAAPAPVEAVEDPRRLLAVLKLDGRTREGRSLLALVEAGEGRAASLRLKDDARDISNKVDSRDVANLKKKLEPRGWTIASGKRNGGPKGYRLERLTALKPAM